MKTGDKWALALALSGAVGAGAGIGTHGVWLWVSVADALIGIWGAVWLVRALRRG